MPVDSWAEKLSPIPVIFAAPDGTAMTWLLTPVLSAPVGSAAGSCVLGGGAATAGAGAAPFGAGGGGAGGGPEGVDASPAGTRSPSPGAACSAPALCSMISF